MEVMYLGTWFSMCGGNGFDVGVGDVNFNDSFTD